MGERKHHRSGNLLPRWVAGLNAPSAPGKVRIARKLDDLGFDFRMDTNGGVTMSVSEWDRLIAAVERGQRE